MNPPIATFQLKLQNILFYLMILAMALLIGLTITAHVPGELVEENIMTEHADMDHALRLASMNANE